MPKFFVLTVQVFLFSIVIAVSHASVASEPAKEEHGKEESKKDEKGSEKKEAADTKKSTPEWVEVMGRIQNLKAKVTAKETAVNALIVSKYKETDPVKLKEIVKNLVSEHKELLKLTEEYEQQRSYFLYRFPEKSMAAGRSYERIEVKPLEEIETQLTLDGKINRTLQKIRKQYGVDEESAKLAEQKQKRIQQQREKSSITEPVVISK
jgi:hypothetical protein